MENTRKITIETRGPIRQKSGVVGPITIPYLEKVSIISRMIIGGVKVIEHLENGETIQLGTKHLKELNANAKIIKENRIQTMDRGRIGEQVQAEQERLAAKKEARVQEAQAEIDAKKEATTVVEEVQDQAPEQQLSKKERKEEARRLAAAKTAAELANARQEDVTEEK